MSVTVGAPTMLMGRGTGIAPFPQAYPGAGAPGCQPVAHHGRTVLPAAVPLQGSGMGLRMPAPLPAAPQPAKAPVALGVQPVPKTNAIAHQGCAVRPQGPPAFMNSAAVKGPPAFKASATPQTSPSMNPPTPVAAMQHRDPCAALQSLSSAQSGSGVAGTQGSLRRSGVILCIGDSLTAGRANTKDSYPAQLEKVLQENKAGNFIMKNVAKWGATCDPITMQLQQAIASGVPCAFVLVLGGTNDIMQYHPAQAILAKLKRLHDMAASAPGRPTVGVFTIPRSSFFNQGQEETRRLVNAGLVEAVQQAHLQTKFLIDLDSVSVDLAKDGLHYHGEGYEQFAQHAFQAMSQLIG